MPSSLVPNGRKRRIPLHWQILTGMVLGAIVGSLSNFLGLETLTSFITTYLKPVGSLFIRAISMVAAPLVLTSLIVGASSISDPARLGRIGFKTLFLFLTTTAVAITIGIILTNVIRPGAGISREVSARLLSSYQEQATTGIQGAENVSIADQLLRIVPANPFQAMADGEMLQIVFFALFAGITLTLIPAQRAAPVIRFFEGASDLLVKMVELVMVLAPYGVFALIAGVSAVFGFEILGTLGWYALTVLLGLLIHAFGVYGVLLGWMASGKVGVSRFFRTMQNVNLLAFSSSSSAASLPLCMETVKDRLGVSDRVTSFVLPLGATVNQHGTALFQGVAALFIAQVYGIDFSISDQFFIVLTVTLASIGVAGIPGAGIVLLIIVLKTIGVPAEGVALIFGIDRILDMCRTVVNVLGDAVVAVCVAATEGEMTSQTQPERLEVSTG